MSIELFKLIKDIQDDDAVECLKFNDILQRSESILGLSDKDLGKELNVNRPTITRWRNGSNAPHPAMRRIVLDYILKKAKE